MTDWNTVPGRRAEPRARVERGVGLHGHEDSVVYALLREPWKAAPLWSSSSSGFRSVKERQVTAVLEHEAKILQERPPDPLKLLFDHGTPAPLRRPPSEDTRWTRLAEKGAGPRSWRTASCSIQRNDEDGYEVHGDDRPEPAATNRICPGRRVGDGRSAMATDWPRVQHRTADRSVKPSDEVRPGEAVREVPIRRRR